ncbi:MAG: hypothetical protein OEW33_03120 [Nitrospirota bacterium]|nr:hypothetical protein [Nitrospirota bacterium]
MKRFNYFFTNVSLHPAVSCVLWVFFITLVLGESCFSQGRAQSKPPPQPIDQELQLAKTKSLYLVVDTTKNIVFLKARGIPLRTFPLTQSAWIGAPLAHSTIVQLNTKDPLISPIPITPPSDSSSESPPEEPAKPLTVNDMPNHYELAFQENLTILVQPHHLPSFWENMVHQIAGWGQRVAARIGTWSGSRQYLVLSLDPTEAQALYWATIPPMTGLVILEKATAK